MHKVARIPLKWQGRATKKYRFCQEELSFHETETQLMKKFYFLHQYGPSHCRIDGSQSSTMSKLRS